jgi:hypothetical protein
MSPASCLPFPARVALKVVDLDLVQRASVPRSKFSLGEDRGESLACVFGAFVCAVLVFSTCARFPIIALVLIGSSFSAFLISRARRNALGSSFSDLVFPRFPVRRLWCSVAISPFPLTYFLPSLLCSCREEAQQAKQTKNPSRSGLPGRAT